MRDWSVGGTSWSRKCAEEDGHGRSQRAGMALPAILFLLSGMIVGLFLGGQFAIAGLVYASLIVSGSLGFWLCGPSTLQRKKTDNLKNESYRSARAADGVNRKPI